MRKNNKGFTLIELLAIIVILAIIAVITVPIILNVIDNAKKGAAKDSAYGLISAAEYYYANNVLNGENGYLFDGSTNILPYINVSGEQPDKGKIYMNDKGEIALAVVYGDYCITKYFNTDLYQSTDVDNCGVNNDFKIPSSYVAFGGEYNDEFLEVLKTSDGGFVAVGQSNSENYNGLKSHGTNMNNDAIIVKYDNNGNIMWSNNFGGSNVDSYYTVLEEEDCYIVLGTTSSTDGDLDKISQGQAIVVVKYDKNNGNIKYKKALFTNTKTNNSYAVKRIIKADNNYYVYIAGRNIDSNYVLCYIVKYDLEFNEIWRKKYSDEYSSSIAEMIETNNNTLLFNVVGYKNAGSMTDIYIADSARFSAVFEISMEDGTILNKMSLGGNNQTTINDIVEVSDGYIIVGISSSNSNHFENLNKGDYDAYIAKIGKMPNDNGFLPIMWLKTFGGTKKDSFTDIVKDGDDLIVSGFTLSSDGDFIDFNNNDNNTLSFVYKFDLNGNVIANREIGGTNYDHINYIIINNNNYLIAGTSFSTDKDMQSFNYGNADAILMNIDKSLNPTFAFEMKPVLVNNLPDLVINYGTEIPLPDGKDDLKLYTTINPTKDLGSWCGTAPNIDPNSNYNYVPCLQPLNNDEKKILISSNNNGGVKLTNQLDVNQQLNDWISIVFSFGNVGKDLELNNLRIKFENGDYITIKDAVNNGYIEPLVLSGDNRSGNYFFTNSFNLLDGNSSGIGSFPSLYILFKPKNVYINNIIFDINKEIGTAGEVKVIQFKNFGVSLSPAQ